MTSKQSAVVHRKGPSGRVPWRSAVALTAIALSACTDDVPVTAPGQPADAAAAFGPGLVVDLSSAAAGAPRYVSRTRDEMLAVRRAGSPSGPVVPIDYMPGQAIVRFEPGSDDLADAQRIVAAAGGSLRQSLLLDRAWIVDVPVGRETAVSAALSAMTGVEFAEPNYVVQLVPCATGMCEEPDDTFLGYKWDLHNDGTITDATGTVLALTGRVDADIDWLEMYDHLGPAFAGSARIGIIDSGIEGAHQDLDGRVAGAMNFALGYPEDLIEDRVGHGTHVAGIAGARGNNGLGVAGVAYAPNIDLLNAKACELYRFPDGSIDTSCFESSVANAIVWAVDNGADVLNLSLAGDPAASSGSALQRAALQYARAMNVLPFCATGNENYPGVAFPARHPECVAVGATNWSDERASYSNYGAELELSAPGGDLNPLGTPFSLILSADASATNSYYWSAGTSMAAPQVAGLAAMLVANGMSDVDDVLARLKATADDIGGPGWDAEFGFGRVNAFQAVTGRRLAEMDVKPATVSLSRSSQLSVYLYSSRDFDATAVDPASVRLYPGGDGAGAAVMRRGTAYMTSTRDYDRDGRTDRMLVFSVAELKAAGLTAGTSTFALRAPAVEGNDATPPAIVP